MGLILFGTCTNLWEEMEMSHLGQFLAFLGIGAVVLCFAILLLKGSSMDRMTKEEKDEMGIKH